MNIREAAMAIDLEFKDMATPYRNPFLAHFIDNWHEPWLVAGAVATKVWLSHGMAAYLAQII